MQFNSDDQTSKKAKDPWSFTFLIKISEGDTVTTLCYLRVSINFMPFSLFNTLCLGKLRPFVVLQHTDTSSVDPKRIIEDVLINFE